MSQDYEEFLASLNSRGVRYLIGGAHALALHARPRATKDLDLFVEPTRRNASRVLRALADFFGGTPPKYVTVESLLDPSTIVQLGVAPVRIDILGRFATLTFDQAWRRRVDARFGGVPAHYLAREHLIAEKRHFDRPQDRADVAALERASSRGGRGAAGRKSNAKKRRRPKR